MLGIQNQGTQAAIVTFVPQPALASREVPIPAEWLFGEHLDSSRVSLLKATKISNDNMKKMVEWSTEATRTKLELLNRTGLKLSGCEEEFLSSEDRDGVPGQEDRPLSEDQHHLLAPHCAEHPAEGRGAAIQRAVGAKRAESAPTAPCMQIR